MTMTLLWEAWCELALIIPKSNHQVLRGSQKEAHDRSGATGSLSSSVMNFEFQHGRRYHSDRAGNYAFPNDDVGSIAS